MIITKITHPKTCVRDKVMFTLSAISFLFFLVLETISMKKILKHDRHLFQLRSLHDESIKYLCANYDTLSKKDYSELRQIIDMSDVTLEMYSHKYKNF